jgi:hypothetical protein
MDALLQSRDAERCMLVVRSGNDHCIHQSRANQFLPLNKCFQRLILVQLSRDGVRNGNQFRPPDFAGRKVAVVVLANIPHADDA